jgi:hypothetical protein
MFADWPALDKWTRAGLLTHYADYAVRVATKPLPENPTDIAANTRVFSENDSGVAKMSLKEFLEAVMPTHTIEREGTKSVRADGQPHGSGNLTHPEKRYIFNTQDDLAGDLKLKGPENHPSIFAAAHPEGGGLPFFQGTPHTGNYFEFAIGPALSGAHMHKHSAAWNAVISGEFHFGFVVLESEGKNNLLSATSRKKMRGCPLCAGRRPVPLPQYGRLSALMFSKHHSHSDGTSLTTYSDRLRFVI